MRKLALLLLIWAGAIQVLLAQASEEIHMTTGDTTIWKPFDNCNMTCLGVSVNSNRCISNNKHPINKLEDLKGIKLRLPEVAHYVANFNALGATTVTMAMTEIFTALQQGTIDACENAASVLCVDCTEKCAPHVSFTAA